MFLFSKNGWYQCTNAPLGSYIIHITGKHKRMLVPSEWKATCYNFLQVTAQGMRKLQADAGNLPSRCNFPHVRA